MAYICFTQPLSAIFLLHFETVNIVWYGCFVFHYMIDYWHNLN